VENEEATRIYLNEIIRESRKEKLEEVTEYHSLRNLEEE
jgi:hypothetical protein